MERGDLKQVLLAGLFLIFIGMSMSPIISPEPVMYSIIIGSIGLLLVVVAVGSLLVKQEMDPKASSLHFYGLLLIGAGPAFLFYSPIAKDGFSFFDWRGGVVRVYFKTSLWWIFPPMGIAFIVLGIALVIWSWYYRNSIDVQHEVASEFLPSTI